MNENGRYIWIGVGAVLLMAAGLLISYTWKKNQGVHAQDSDLTLQDLSLSGSSDSIVSMPQDSIKADSLAALAKKRNQILNEVRHIADGEGFKSTRASIIERLYNVKYLKNDPIEPSQLGMAVIDALTTYAPHITSPDMTAPPTRYCYSMTSTSTPGNNG